MDADGNVSAYADESTTGIDANGDPIINNDILDGGAGDDMIIGGLGNDIITGGEGDDVVVGGFGNDVIDGGAGDDVVFGGAGSDTFIGGAGSDTFIGGAGNDRIVGGDSAGVDVVDYSAAGEDQGLVINLAAGQAMDATGSVGFINLDTLEGIEHIITGAGDDHIIGGDGGDILDGGAGDDTIEGGFGDDILIGGEGNNVLIGGGGDDVAQFDGQLRDFGFEIQGDDFVVTYTNEAGEAETTVLQDIEQLRFVSEDTSGEVTTETLSIIEASGVEDQALELDLASALSLDAVPDQIMVEGFPEGTTLTVDGQTLLPNEDGYFILEPNQLSDVSANLPENFGDDLAIDIQAMDADGETVGRALMSVEMDAIADAPNLELTDVFGPEDTAIALSIDAGLVDTDGSESLSIALAGIPDGPFGDATVSAILDVEQANGSIVPTTITFQRDDFGDFVIEGYSGEEMAQIMETLTMTTPLHHDEDFTLQVTATATEINDDTGANNVETTVGSMEVVIFDRADAPTLELENAAGLEDEMIHLDISAATVDPSETLSVSISGIPDGAKFFVEFIPRSGDPFMVQLPLDDTGSVTIPSYLIGNDVAITPDPDPNDDFDLSVTATAHEPDASEVDENGGHHVGPARVVLISYGLPLASP